MALQAFQALVFLESKKIWDFQLPVSLFLCPFFSLCLVYRVSFEFFGFLETSYFSIEIVQPI